MVFTMVQTTKLIQCYLGRFQAYWPLETRANFPTVPGSGLFKSRVKQMLLSGFIVSFLASGILGESLETQEGSQSSDGNSSGVQGDAASFPRTAGLSSRLNRRMASSLWDGRIAVVPETEQQKRDKQELQKLIARINGVHVRDKKTSPVSIGGDTAQIPISNAGPKAAVQIEASSIDTTSALPAPTGDAGPVRTDKETGALSPEILLKVMKLSDRPEALMDPFGIAEILYSTGHLPEAARFYEKALERIDPDDAAGARKRAWVIFQNANCLRRQQPVQAAEIYQRLMREYPDSPWKDAAQIWLSLAEWYSKEKPVELIQECEQLKLSVNRILSELDS
jgi:tetratricopeptide (TPR) repeat protein